MIKNYLLSSQEEVKKGVNPWAGSVFEDIVTFGADKRGELGEVWFSHWVSKSSKLIVQEDITSKTIKDDGHYDMKINGKRIEIKTAYRGASNSWQHENIYEQDLCDINVFVDIDYKGIYLSVVKRGEVPFGAPNAFFGSRKRATLRAGKTDGYKFDFSNVQVNLLIKKGRGLFIDPEETTEKEIAEFLEGIL